MKGQQRIPWLVVCFCLLLFSLALAGCGTNAPTPEPTQAPAPTAAPPTVTRTPFVPTPTDPPPATATPVAPTPVAPTPTAPTPTPEPAPQTEPGAGAWQTWVLESGSQFRPDAPPDEAATAAEIAELMDMAAARDEADLLQIVHWNAGPPAYRWNQIALEALNQRGVPAPVGLRQLALLHAAIYDATVAAWDGKYTYCLLYTSRCV